MQSVRAMKIAKYFFGCPNCGSHYLDKRARGNSTLEIMYHFFVCVRCHNAFARLTKSGKFVDYV